MDLRSLYQEVIVDHNRSPRNYGELDNASCCADGFNPLCGDKVKLALQIDNDVITDVKFTGKGCAISTASASLMTDFLIGKSREEAVAMFQSFQDAIVNKNAEAEASLGKLRVLAGVKEFPARVKCATLAWHTLRAALANETAMVTTE